MNTLKPTRLHAYPPTRLSAYLPCACPGPALPLPCPAAPSGRRMDDGPQVHLHEKQVGSRRRAAHRRQARSDKVSDAGMVTCGVFPAAQHRGSCVQREAPAGFVERLETSAGHAVGSYAYMPRGQA